MPYRHFVPESPRLAHSGEGAAGAGAMLRRTKDFSLSATEMR
jgi:hypothetical protein